MRKANLFIFTFCAASNLQTALIDYVLGETIYTFFIVKGEVVCFTCGITTHINPKKLKRNLFSK